MATTKTARLVKVKATTNNITRGIINFLNVRGHYAFRVNSTGIWDPVKQVIRRPNSPRGIADIVCCLRLKDRSAGMFLSIEIKNAQTKDRMRPNQKQFALDIAQAGGWPLVVTSYGEFLRWYEDQERGGNL